MTPSVLPGLFFVLNRRDLLCALKRKEQAFLLILNQEPRNVDFPLGFKAQAFQRLKRTSVREIGIRFHPTRGGSSIGPDDGGYGPESLCEREEDMLEDMQRLISRYHDNSRFVHFS